MTFSSSILLKTSMVVTLPASSSPFTLESSEIACGSCYLRWRQKQLWVRQKRESDLILPALSNELWLHNCLQSSAVETIYLDWKLGKRAILTWAAIARSTNKKVWVRIPRFTSNANSVTAMKKAMDWLGGVSLLLLLSPSLLFLILFLKLVTGSAGLKKEWCLDEKGRLFERLSFSTDNLPLDSWLEKTGLAGLPQLWNVAKGEMRLTGLSAFPLEEALR